MNDNISQIVFNNIQWIDISKKGKEEIEYLRKSFSFDSLDVDECERDTKHSNIFVKRDYIYFEILFPVYDRKTKLINSYEINFFIKGDMLITMHDNKITQLTDFFYRIQDDEILKNDNFQNNPIRLLSGILSNLFGSCFPMLNHMDEDILLLEKEIFTSARKTNSQIILRLRWNVINFRRTIQSYKNIIEKLIATGDNLFSMSKLKVYYSDLIEKTKDIWIMLENQKDSISALQQTNESLTSFELNDIMKVLALISAVMMPPAFITSLFGINADMPFVHNDIAFFLVLGLCISIIIFFILYFKKRKWL